MMFGVCRERAGDWDHFCNQPVTVGKVRNRCAPHAEEFVVDVLILLHVLHLQYT